VVLLTLTLSFTRTMSLSRYQGEQQHAVQLATDAMEQMRALPGSALAAGRDADGVQEQLRAVPAATALGRYLADMEPVVDPLAAAGSGVTAALPTAARTVRLDGVPFEQSWYVGRCWQAAGGGPCSLAGRTLPAPVQLLRVVVAVSWTAKDCAGDACTFYTSTLVDGAAVVPRVSTPPPVVVPAPPSATTAPGPTAPPSATPAPSPLPAAIWANRTTDSAEPAAFTVTGSMLTITGLVHSNADIHLDRAYGSVSPRIEYGTTYTKPISGMMLRTPAAVKVTPGPPAHRDIGAYRPGGSAAGTGWKQMPCAGGAWSYSAADVGAASVVYVPCNVVISDGTVNLKALLVAEGTIRINGSAVTVGDPAVAHRTGLVSNSSAATAIYIGGSLTKIYGNVQALRGGVHIDGSATTLQCGVIGDTIAVTGAATTITVDAGCAG
jgi:hypothetical protein